MLARRPHINRVLSRDVSQGKARVKGQSTDPSRSSRFPVVDFSSLKLPDSVCPVLAEAFWNQVDVKCDRTVYGYWFNLRVFARFVAETHSVQGLADVHSELLARYIEWLNARRGRNGEPWSKATRYSNYTTLRTLLRSVQRCRPGVLGEIEFPYNPFAWKNRDSRRVEKLSAQTLRAILRACEQDITRLRTVRETANQEMATVGTSEIDSISTRGELMQVIDRHFGGILPSWPKLRGPGLTSFKRALSHHWGWPAHPRALVPVQRGSVALLPVDSDSHGWQPRGDRGASLRLSATGSAAGRSRVGGVGQTSGRRLAATILPQHGLLRTANAHTRDIAMDAAAATACHGERS